jgi:hypothetical protein
MGSYSDLIDWLDFVMNFLMRQFQSTEERHYTAQVAVLVMEEEGPLAEAVKTSIRGEVYSSDSVTINCLSVGHILQRTQPQ